MTEGFDTHKANETTDPAEDHPYYSNAGLVNRGATAGTNAEGAVTGDAGAEAGLQAARASGNGGEANYAEVTRGPR